MSKQIHDDAIKQIFTEARSHKEWLDKPVSDELLHKIYDLTKWGPTSANGSPMRLIFVRSPEAKEKLLPTLMGGNVAQVKAAPVTAIIAQDMEFYQHFPKLFPMADLRPMFSSNKALTETTALRNSSLQGAYFMLAVRAVGLDVGPMSGFDNAKVDEAFMGGTTWKSNFICNIGYGNAEKLFPRGPRLDFKETCKIV